MPHPAAVAARAPLTAGASQPVRRQAAAQGLPHSAAVLAYAGALPPILAAMLAVFRGDDFGPAALQFMTIYGGALVVFFGGVRWGVAVMTPEGPTFRHLLGGAMPFLIAMPIFVIDSMVTRLALILLILPVLLLDDLRATKAGSGAPDWYLGVRTPLTILVESAFLAAFAAQIVS